MGDNEFDALLEAGSLGKLPKRKRTRLRGAVEEAATAYCFLRLAENAALPSAVERDLKATRAAASRLLRKLDDLDARATPEERKARGQVLALLGEAWEQRDPKADRGPGPGGFEVVADAVRLVADLAEEADGLLEKADPKPRHERTTAKPYVMTMLNRAWERARGKPLSTKSKGPSGRFVRAFFRTVADERLSDDQTRRLLRALRVSNPSTRSQ